MKTNHRLHIMIKGGNYRGKGAEAMMTTVQQAIIDKIPESVCCAFFSSESERIRFLVNGIYPIKRKRTKKLSMLFLMIRSTLSWLLDKWNLSVKKTNIEDNNVFSISNIVVDISGFASSDQYGWRKSASRLNEMFLAKAAGNRILYMPQSWGPFNDFRTKFFTRFMLSQSEFVFAREKQSYDFLLNASCVKPEKLFLSPDIAFQFQAAKPDRAKNLLKKAGISIANDSLIAITPNMRIYERTLGKDGDNAYVKDLLQIINIFLSNTNCKIILMPHEATLNKANDFELCQTILKNIDGRDRVFLFDGKKTAAETKAIIGLCDLLVASRYHSLIAALSMRVPSVVIGWSHKYDDVMREVWLEKWIVDSVRHPGKDIGELAMEAWNHREEMRRTLDIRVPKLETESNFALQKMTDTIEDIIGSFKG